MQVRIVEVYFQSQPEPLASTDLNTRGYFRTNSGPHLSPTAGPRKVGSKIGLYTMACWLGLANPGERSLGTLALGNGGTKYSTEPS